MTRKSKRAVTVPDALEVPRQPDGKWLPGASPNPSGMPKWVTSLRDALRANAEEGAALGLAVIRDQVVPELGILEPPAMADRLRAWEYSLRYSVPVPKLEVEVSSPSPALERLRQASTEALIAALDAVEKRDE